MSNAKQITRVANEIVDSLTDAQLADAAAYGYQGNEDEDVCEAVKNIAMCILAGACRRR